MISSKEALFEEYKKLGFDQDTFDMHDFNWILRAMHNYADDRLFSILNENQTNALRLAMSKGFLNNKMVANMIKSGNYKETTASGVIKALVKKGYLEKVSWGRYKPCSKLLCGTVSPKMKND